MGFSAPELCWPAPHPSGPPWPPRVRKRSVKTLQNLASSGTHPNLPLRMLLLLEDSPYSSKSIFHRDFWNSPGVYIGGFYVMFRHYGWALLLPYFLALLGWIPRALECLLQ